MRILTKEEIEEFKVNGVLVIKGFYNNIEIEELNNQFDDYLRNQRVDLSNLEVTGGNLANLSSTGGAGGILDIYYADWKLRLNENPEIFSIMCSLWDNTYALNEMDFEHPYKALDASKGFMYIDRICCRVPDAISNMHTGTMKKKCALQRSLTPHLDCCPQRLFEEINKWRPIQMFLALTDTMDKDQGGFEACYGHHRNFKEWVSNRKGSGPNKEAPCVGAFTPIRPIEDSDVISRMQHVPCAAGDLVVWDFRIPHANSRYNSTTRSRKVIYLGKRILCFKEQNIEYLLLII